MIIKWFDIFFLSYTVLRPNITDITITPSPSDNNLLLHQFNETVSFTCTAEGGPRIMTRWQFDNGSSIANGSNSVTYIVPSLSTAHTGVYYCEAIIDRVTDSSMNYTLYGEYTGYTKNRQLPYREFFMVMIFRQSYIAISPSKSSLSIVSANTANAGGLRHCPSTQSKYICHLFVAFCFFPANYNVHILCLEIVWLFCGHTQGYKGNTVGYVIDLLLNQAHASVCLVS